MCIGGRLGAEVSLSADISSQGGLSDAELMFSESNSRFVVEVAPDNATALRECFNGLPLHEIGTVGGDKLKLTGSAGSAIDLPVDELVDAFRKPLYEAVGEKAPE